MRRNFFHYTHFARSLASVRSLLTSGLFIVLGSSSCSLHADWVKILGTFLSHWLSPLDRNIHFWKSSWFGSCVMSADVSRNHACTNQRNQGVNRGFTNIFKQEGNWRGKRFELNLNFFLKKIPLYGPTRWAKLSWLLIKTLSYIAYLFQPLIKFIFCTIKWQEISVFLLDGNLAHDRLLLFPSNSSFT